MPAFNGASRPSYTAHAVTVMAERRIPREWAERVLLQPDWEEPDRTDPALRHALGRIEEYDGRVLRVIDNATVIPPRIVTAYFDRSMRNRL